MKKLFAFFWDKSLLIFAIIGAVNTVITMVGTQLLMGPFTNLWGENVAYWASSATMFFLTSIEAFFLNRHFSFESKAPMGKSAVRFATVVAVCYLLSFSMSKWLVPTFIRVCLPQFEGNAWVLRIALLVAQVIYTGCNYLGQRLWACKE